MIEHQWKEGEEETKFLINHILIVIGFLG